MSHQKLLKLLIKGDSPIVANSARDWLKYCPTEPMKRRELWGKSGFQIKGELLVT